MFAAFPVHIVLLVKGKYDGFVSGNVQEVSIENAFFSALNENEKSLDSSRLGFYSYQISCLFRQLLLKLKLFCCSG